MSGLLDTAALSFSTQIMAKFLSVLTKELTKRLQVAQGHLTIYHPQKNGLAERQNLPRVYCSRYIDDWEKHLLHVMGAYNEESPHLHSSFWSTREGEQHRKRTCVM